MAPFTYQKFGAFTALDAIPTDFGGIEESRTRGPVAITVVAFVLKSAYLGTETLPQSLKGRPVVHVLMIGNSARRATTGESEPLYVPASQRRSTLSRFQQPANANLVA
jgi:hypothetical protein